MAVAVGGVYTDEFGRFKGKGNLILKKERSLASGVALGSNASSARPHETPTSRLLAESSNPETSPRQRAGMKLYMPPTQDHRAMQQ